MTPKILFDDEGNEYQVLRSKGNQFVVERVVTERKQMNYSRRVSSSSDCDSSDEEYSRRFTKAPSPQRRLPSKARRTIEPISEKSSRSSKQDYSKRPGPISNNILELIEEDEKRTTPNSRMKLLSRAERARR